MDNTTTKTMLKSLILIQERLAVIESQVKANQGVLKILFKASEVKLPEGHTIEALINQLSEASLGEELGILQASLQKIDQEMPD